jgi:hypothetical protein
VDCAVASRRHDLLEPFRNRVPRQLLGVPRPDGRAKIGVAAEGAESFFPTARPFAPGGWIQDNAGFAQNILGFRKGYLLGGFHLFFNPAMRNFPR